MGGLSTHVTLLLLRTFRSVEFPPEPYAALRIYAPRSDILAVARSIPTGPRANGLSQTRSSNLLSSAKRLGPSTVLHSRSMSRRMSWIFCVGGASALRHADNARAALVGRVGPDEIAETFEAPEQLIHGLLAHFGALGQQAGANAIRTRKLQHRHVRYAQFLEPGRVELRDDPALNGLGRHAQQRADEHVLRLDR